MPRVEPDRFQPLSTAEAVLRYAGDFIPSWAGAISIDLMPAVLVLIFCVVHAAIRREGQPEAERRHHDRRPISLTALQLAREVESRAVRPRSCRRRAVPAVAPAAARDENVTALATARAGKKD